MARLREDQVSKKRQDDAQTEGERQETDGGQCLYQGGLGQKQREVRGYKLRQDDVYEAVKEEVGDSKV